MYEKKIKYRNTCFFQNKNQKQSNLKFIERF